MTIFSRKWLDPETHGYVSPLLTVKYTFEEFAKSFKHCIVVSYTQSAVDGSPASGLTQVTECTGVARVTWHFAIKSIASTCHIFFPSNYIGINAIRARVSKKESCQHRPSLDARPVHAHLNIVILLCSDWYFLALRHLPQNIQFPTTTCLSHPPSAQTQSRPRSLTSNLPSARTTRLRLRKIYAWRTCHRISTLVLRLWNSCTSAQHCSIVCTEPSLTLALVYTA